MKIASEHDLRSRLAGIVGASHVDAIELPPRGPKVPLALPADEAEIVELVRLAAHDGLAIVPCGLGSKLGWYARPVRADFALSTRRLSGVVAYEPGDGTITAHAGSTIAALAAVANTGGHHLSPDVARPARATLGGVLAAGESGSDRLRYGPVRHQVLGMKVVLGGGTIAQSGGRLVKNVTGFDLHRLYCGSHGTLCVILEASLRLHPRQDREAWITTVAPTLEGALELARAALDAGVRLCGLHLTAVDGSGFAQRGWALFARLAARSEVLEVEIAALERAWPKYMALVDDEAHGAALDFSSEGFETGSEPWLHIGCMPSKLAHVLASVLALSTDPDLAPRLLAQPGIALVDVQLRGRDATGVAPEKIAELTHRLRAELAPLGASVALRAGGAALELVDPFGDPGPGVELMRRLLSALDPHAVFARGRFQPALGGDRT